MIMGLSLSVFALAEHKIRNVMSKNNLNIKNQKNKPASKIL
jgi:hypothetical protein